MCQGEGWKRTDPDLQRDWDSGVQPACPAPGGDLRDLLGNQPFHNIPKENVGCRSDICSSD